MGPFLVSNLQLQNQEDHIFRRPEVMFFPHTMFIHLLPSATQTIFIHQPGLTQCLFIYYLVLQTQCLFIYYLVLHPMFIHLLPDATHTMFIHVLPGVAQCLLI